MMKLPPRGTKIEDLRCPKCKKLQKECKPKDCIDPECPYKKLQNVEAKQGKLATLFGKVLGRKSQA